MGNNSMNISRLLRFRLINREKWRLSETAVTLGQEASVAKAKAIAQLYAQGWGPTPLSLHQIYLPEKGS